MSKRTVIGIIVIFASALVSAQPKVVDGGVLFTIQSRASSVVLAGDFNGWSHVTDRMAKNEKGTFSVVKKLKPGVYEYKFLADSDWVLDEANPGKVANYNNTSQNSIFTLTENNTILFHGYMPSSDTSMNDSYPSSGGTLYLNIIWHQHQPLYLDPQSDQLQGPWVRTHGTKDYYDMASILEQYPKVHYNVNLTSSLLFQLEKYYVERLRPYVDVRKDRVDTGGFFAHWRGKTDPWIDLALKPTKAFDAADMNFLLYNVWNAFGISDVQILRFPEYKALRDRAAKKDAFSEQDLRDIKFWFYLAHFDPDFLEKKIALADGTTIDLTDLVEKRNDGKYYLRKTITEDDCNRIVAEAYKVLANIIPIHKKLMYHPSTYEGQIEVATTPFYHPILPLIFDTQLARICQPNDSLPNRFHYPQDADAQVAKAVEYYTETFGQAPFGMWPGEGSVAKEIVPIFGKNGIRWIATDAKILARSKPYNQPEYYPYAVYADHGDSDSVVVVFRDTEISDKIGFTYQNFRGEDAADDFIKSVLRYAPKAGEPDRLLTVILDGENAWEWYRQDNDGKEFMHALYRKLSALYDTRQIISVTMTEYMQGNPKRGVAPHPISSMKKLDWLYPGSWINANFDTWIGEDEENRAWNYLLVAREDLGKSGLPQPDPKSPEPREGTKKYLAYKAWEEMYAAEGSDWFWWYGTDQTAPAGDKPFDIAYITHLKNIYAFARQAGGTMPEREFKEIIIDDGGTASKAQGTMAQSRTDSVSVVFQCDARGIYVRKAIYIVGNQPKLGDWKPNIVRMFDDGTHADEHSGDSVWTIELRFPVGTEVQYKFTNSGPGGEWNPGEEFPAGNRKIYLDGSVERVVLKDVFGKQ
ncbi:MAG TPA: carbohydrate-binding module family 20 domain-containing protein [Bacteroidota bacterium]|nr:carbohydrate-binding module family 20 domain-containing protein [Bacteroidota bacterium]